MKRKILVILILLKFLLFLSFLFPQFSFGEEKDLISLIIEERELIVGQRNSYGEKIGGLIDSLNVLVSKEIELSSNDEIEIGEINASLLVASFFLETILRETEEKKHYFSKEVLSSFSIEKRLEILSLSKRENFIEKKLEEEIKKIEEQVNCLLQKYFIPI